MAITERKEKEKLALKTKILEAAEKLMAEKGFENLSMRKIAKEIDYSPTTIYRFFKDKNDLLSTIISRNHIEITKRFQKVLENEALSPFEKLKQLIKEYIKFGIEYTDTYKLYADLCRLEIIDNGLYEIINGKQYRIFRSWQEQIELLIKSGEFTDKKSIDIILLIWHTTHGFISNRITLQDFPWKSDEEEMEQIIEMIFNGIRK